mgnify:CR=1 FL=1
MLNVLMEKIYRDSILFNIVNVLKKIGNVISIFIEKTLIQMQNAFHMNFMNKTLMLLKIVKITMRFLEVIVEWQGINVKGELNIIQLDYYVLDLSFGNLEMYLLNCYLDLGFYVNLYFCCYCLFHV